MLHSVFQFNGEGFLLELLALLIVSKTEVELIRLDLLLQVVHLVSATGMVANLTPWTRIAVIKYIWSIGRTGTDDGLSVLLLYLVEVLRVAPVGVLTAQWAENELGATCLLLFAVAFFSVSEVAGGELFYICK